MNKVVLSLLILTFVATGFKCDKNGGEDDGVYNGTTYNTHQIKSPQQATLSAKFQPQVSWGPLVDQGIANLNRIASAPPNNYDVSDMPASRYTVYYFPRSSKCENPAFLVNATGTSYEGSQWDKDPSPKRCIVCAAGLTFMVGYPIPHSPGMVITDDVGIMSTIVWFEGEHGFLWFKDPDRYNATAYHDENNGHPIMGYGPPELVAKLEGLKANGYKFVTIESPVDVTDGNSIVIPKGRPFCVLLTR